MFSAVQYVSKDQSEAVLFVFRVYLSDPTNLPMVHLRGLNPTALYEVDGYSGPRSGASWMEAGLRVELKNLQSKILKIKQVE
jgi:alpha-galactosidase